MLDLAIVLRGLRDESNFFRNLVPLPRNCCQLSFLLVDFLREYLDYDGTNLHNNLANHFKVESMLEVGQLSPAC